MELKKPIPILRDYLYQAAEIARQCTNEVTRERVVVSQAVAIAVREILEKDGIAVIADGRSSQQKYVDLLDVCDFTANGWQVEVRVVANAPETALYVPTTPLLVGYFSDIYLCVHTDVSLTKAEVLGFATRADLSDADLTGNGLFALLSVEELRPVEELKTQLSKERTTDQSQVEMFNDWQARATRIMHGLRDLLAGENVFDESQSTHIASRLRDEVMRVYGKKLPQTGIEPLLKKLLRRFGMDEPLPAHPENLLAFDNEADESANAGSKETGREFFNDQLPLRERVGYYRHLLTDYDALSEHQRTRRILNQATGGQHQTTPRRREKMQTQKEERAKASVRTPLSPKISEEIIKQEFEDVLPRTIPITANPLTSQSTTMLQNQLQPNVIIRGSLFPEAVQVITTIRMGDSIKIIGKGLESNKVYEPVLNAEQLTMIALTGAGPTFDGDPLRFRLGIEALRLGLAYEYDPYFSLSIARVDPLPHQLEAVYDYFLKLPRIRFLLADDPGAGKTIMAGLLLKELKIRGLAKRTLIVTPASLSFQWQREMKDKFREDFEVVRGDVLRANYGANPFQDKNQVIASVSWVSVIEDAKNSLLRSHWDLIIVDEAHKMSAYSSDKKTLAYQLGESLSTMTDHYLLMTATPHKGDPKNFCLFLELLDKDVYGSVKSLEEAMRRNSAPFYLRRTKEALITFPDPETGKSKKIFTKRNVETVGFQINDEELDFYDALSDYVEDQSIKASVDDSARGRALTFTMAMLQRRFSSSIYAVRRSLQRMMDKRQRILDDPAGYRQEQMIKQRPKDFDDLTEAEQQKIIDELEEVVASVDPVALRQEIHQLRGLIAQAMELEEREIESKLVKLREEIVKQGVFDDPKMKLLIFTEHKDTLDFLVARLRDWGLSVTQIHGGMNVGDRDTPNTRIYAEREFRESAQVLVATEAAGEGINLQFCWLMINYDIPWNPVRLEQRMGRIHRYGQEKDCLIFNFVSLNTREGRVLAKLLEKLKEIRKELGTDHVFDVIGEIFPANQLEKMFREMYAHILKEEDIKARIVEEIDVERFKRITHSTLEGLAKRDLNISALVGKSTEARERRLVPEVIEDFFIQAGPLSGVQPKETKTKAHIYRLGRIPRTLYAIGDKLEQRFGRLGREYKQIVFDKKLLTADSTSEWVTPGHPLFEAVREDVYQQVRQDLELGSVFYDLNTEKPYRLDVFSASIKDGRGNHLHRRLFAVQTETNGAMTVKQPTVFLDLALAPQNTPSPTNDNLPDRFIAEQVLIEQALNPFLAEVAEERIRENETIRQHLEISLNTLIDRQNVRFAELMEQQESGDATTSPIAANLKQAENKLDELNERLERRRKELEQERQCTIGDIVFVGSSWVMPHPDRNNPEIAPMVRDEEIERIAVETVIAYEEARGWVVESVESENRGFDLISRKLHAEDPQTAVDVRFIEVKGRARIGEVGLTTNEYKTAERLKKDYWLYVVFNCATTPEVHTVQDPVRLGWKPVQIIEHYQVGAEKILSADK